MRCRREGARGGTQRRCLAWPPEIEFGFCGAVVEALSGSDLESPAVELAYSRLHQQQRVKEMGLLVENLDAQVVLHGELVACLVEGKQLKSVLVCSLQIQELLVLLIAQLFVPDDRFVVALCTRTSACVQYRKSRLGTICVSF